MLDPELIGSIGCLVVHLGVCLYLYFREPHFYLGSVYVLAMLGFYFLPSVVNHWVYADFRLHLPVELTWLAGSLAVLGIRHADGYRVPVRGPARLGSRAYTQLVLAVIVAAAALLFGRGAAYVPWRVLLFGSYLISIWVGLVAYRRRAVRLYRWALGAALLCVGVFAFGVWTGHGRLHLTRYVLGLFVLTTLICPPQPTHRLKMAVLLLLPVGLGLLGGLRSLPTAGSTHTYGLASILHPTRYTQRLYVDMETDRFAAQNGRSYLVALLALYPRRWWPTKPDGFGRTLFLWYVNDDSGTMSSLAGSYVGESLGNFRRLGLWIAPLVLGGFVLFIRELSRDGQLMMLESHERLLLQVLPVLVLPDLLWGGLFTATSRLMLTVLGLAVLLTTLRVGSRLCRQAFV